MTRPKLHLDADASRRALQAGLVGRGHDVTRTPMSRSTPRQRVLDAIHFRQPERVPFSWGLLATAEMQAVMTAFLKERGINWQALCAATEDSVHISPCYNGPPLPAHTDEWGIVRQAVSYGSGSYDEIAHYPLKGFTRPASVHAHPWPDPLHFDYASLRADTLRLSRGGLLAVKLDIPICGNPLETYTWMTGLQETLINLVDQPDVVHAAMEHITAIFEARLRLAAAQVADLVDICYFGDDVGGQHGLLISPNTYRAMIKPYLVRLLSLGRQLFPLAKMMFHTDGSVFDLLGELIDTGVEILEAVQVDAAKMEPERLKNAFGSRLAFHGAISVQSLLPLRTAAEVEQECRHLVSVLGAGGGFVAAPTHAIQVGTPPENVMAMLRGVLGEEDYQAALKDAAQSRVDFP
jgi:uroporphyrinogen decarboxylase